MKLKREYSWSAYRPGGLMFEDFREVSCNLRIRAVAVLLFRKWFGREPKESWGENGGHAEARDERGNQIWVDQTNHTLRRWGTPDPRLWTLFALVDGRFQPYIPTSHQIAWKEAA